MNSFLVSFFILCAWMCCLRISLCSTCKARGASDPLGLIYRSGSPTKLFCELKMFSFSSQCSSLAFCLSTCTFIEKLFDLLIKVYFVMSLLSHCLHYIYQVNHFKYVLENMYKYNNKIYRVHFCWLCVYGPGMNN